MTSIMKKNGVKSVESIQAMTKVITTNKYPTPYNFYCYTEIIGQPFMPVSKEDVNNNTCV